MNLWSNALRESRDEGDDTRSYNLTYDKNFVRKVNVTFLQPSED